jgi:hypothetical protein
LQAEDGDAAAAGEQPAEDEDLLVDLSLKKKKKKKKVRRHGRCGVACTSSSLRSIVAYDASMRMCTGSCNHLVQQLPTCCARSRLCFAASVSRATVAQQSAV